MELIPEDSTYLEKAVNGDTFSTLFGDEVADDEVVEVAETEADAVDSISTPEADTVDSISRPD